MRNYIFYLRLLKKKTLGKSHIRLSRADHYFFSRTIASLGSKMETMQKKFDIRDGFKSLKIRTYILLQKLNDIGITYEILYSFLYILDSKIYTKKILFWNF